MQRMLTFIAKLIILLLLINAQFVNNVYTRGILTRKNSVYVLNFQFLNKIAVPV
jgi:hypothetical protein